MDIVAQEKKNNKRYLPHTVSTKSISFVWRYGFTAPSFVLTVWGR